MSLPCSSTIFRQFFIYQLIFRSGVNVIMRFSSICFLLLSWLLFTSTEKVSAHNNDSLKMLSPRAVHKMQRKYDRMAKRINNQNKKMLSGMLATEQKLAVAIKDSSGNIRELYKQWSDKLTAASEGNINLPLQQYNGRLDSLQTILSFLQGSGSISLGGGIDGAVYNNLSSSLGQVQQQLQLSHQLQAFIRSRRDFWQPQQLLQAGLMKNFSALNKQVYYYGQQLAHVKTVLNEPDKLFNMAFQYLAKEQAFRSFMLTNSQLAQLFRIPSASVNQASIAGLQTRSMVQGMVAAQLPSAVNAQEVLQQQLSLAQAELNKLKDKVNALGGGSSELDIPGFKPNQQKTKSFWKRFELGLDIQSQRPNRLLPVTSDIAFSVGYKLSDKSTIGFGAGYKLGWGKNFSNISFTSEGLSLRSFLDIKIKGGLWITGGYEYNYQQAFTRIRELQNSNAWQKSGLIGATRKYKIGKKEGKLQLLWDFLSYSQMPRTQPLKFRIGYQF